MPVIPNNADPVKKVAVDLEIEEWEYKLATAFKIILQSVDASNKVIIQSYQTAAVA